MARDSSLVEVYLRNNKAWFKSVDLVLYRPGDERGQVESKLMLPLQRLSLEVPVGTKVYIAGRAQLRRWKQGQDLSASPPDITIRESDAGEEYDMYR